MSDNEVLREAILKNVLAISEAWPDIVALWSGMVKQLTDEGWTESSARALVLSSVTADNGAIMAVLDLEDDDDDGTSTH